MKKVLIATAVFLFTATSVWAVPELQIGIEDGYYDGSTETVFIDASTFTFYTLATATTYTPYYIAFSLVPDPGQIDPLAGDFSVNGVSDGGAVNVSALSAWMYGAPDNIPNSGWPTQYKYITFDFDDIAKAEEYNTQDSPDGWAAYDGTGNFLYSAAFYVDMTSLSSNYSLHIGFLSRICG